MKLKQLLLTSIILAITSIYPSIVMAQTVAVTGTITDTQTTPYSNGLLTVTFVNATGQLATFGGNPSFQKSYAIYLDSNGAFTISLPPNSTASPSIQPAGTQWNFSYQSQGGYGAANINVTITGAGSISGTLSNLARITWPYGNIPPPGASGQGIVFVSSTTLGWGATGGGTSSFGPNYAVGGGIAQAQTVAPTTPVTNATLVDGYQICWSAIAPNSGPAPTLAGSGTSTFSAHAIVKNNGAPLIANDIVALVPYACAQYNLANTQFVLQNPQAGIGALTSLQAYGSAAQGSRWYPSGGCTNGPPPSCSGNYAGAHAGAALSSTTDFQWPLVDGSGNAAIVTDGLQNLSAVQLPQYIAGAGAANVMTATFVPAFSAYAAGDEFDILPNLANTTTNPTLNVNALGAKTVTKCGTAVLLAGDYSTTAVAKFIYDGTRMQLQNPVSGCAAIPIGNIGSAGLSGTSPVTISAAGAIGCATCVATGQTNAYGAFLQDFSAATMEIPEAPGFAATVDSTIGLDTTANTVHLWINGADSIGAAFATAPAGTKCVQTSGTTGLLSEATGPCASSPAYPLTVSGTINSGGIPYFNSTVQESSSALLAVNALMVGGGAGAAPATGNADFTYAAHTLTGAAAGLVDLSAQSGANSFKIPVGAGLISGANGAIAYDTTAGATHVRSNAADSLAAAEAAAIVANTVPKATNSTNSLITASSMIDNGTNVTSTDTGGFVAPVFVANGTTAGFVDYPQGTTSAAVAPCNAATSICRQAPASVTSYVLNLAPTAPVNNNSAEIFSNANPGVGSFAKIPQLGLLTADYTNATTGFTSLTNLAFPVEANTNYHMHCNLIWSASAATAGPQYQITGPASPTAVVIQMDSAITGTTAAAAAVTAFSSAMNPVGAIVVTATNEYSVVDMDLRNGANAGTVQVQAAAQGTGTLTIRNASGCQLQ